MEVECHVWLLPQRFASYCLRLRGSLQTIPEGQVEKSDPGRIFVRGRVGNGSSTAREFCGRVFRFRERDSWRPLHNHDGRVG
jgi:hypothetical protein